MLIVLSGYFVGRGRSLAMAGGRRAGLHSLPSYYGLYIALWVGVPSLFLLLFWLFLEPILVEAMVLGRVAGGDAMTVPEQQVVLASIRNIARRAAEMDAFQIAAFEEQLRIMGAAAGDWSSAARSLTQDEAERLLQILDIRSTDNAPELLSLALTYNDFRQIGDWLLFAVAMTAAAGAFAITHRQIGTSMRARNRVEGLVRVLLILCSVIAILTTIGIILSLLFESFRFFTRVPFWEFFFGLQWSPQIAIRADQAGASGAFGIIPLFAGTLLIGTIAMLVAVPIGLTAAIYLSDYAHPKVRSVIKPLMEILAGIPTVVYGFFAILTVAPVVRDFGNAIGIDASANSALAAGIVMGIMIVPFVSSLSDDVMNAVPQAMRDGSFGLGATKSETIRHVILPAALPGIVGAILLAASRAIGETMIVVMAAGLAANLTLNPFDAVTTVTVQIATLLVGDQEFDSSKTLSVFALGLVLFAVTLCLNVVALRVVQKYREKYD